MVTSKTFAYDNMATSGTSPASMATNRIFQSKIRTGAGPPPEYRSRGILPVELEHYSMAFSRSRRTLKDVRSTPGGTDGLRCLMFKACPAANVAISPIQRAHVHKVLYTACEGPCRNV